MTSDERVQRESNLIATIIRQLPELAKACVDDSELVLLHQDAFAADRQEDEYTLLNGDQICRCFHQFGFPLPTRGHPIVCR